MTYTISANQTFNSLEISFDCKPSEAVRDALQALRFRWHRVKKVWYGFASEAEVKAAIDGKPAAKTAEKCTAKGTKQDHIRIYYNGIKIDGGKLIRWADSYRQRIAAAESRIKAFEAMKDPGQPTAEDLEEVARQRKEEEEAAEAARKAEQEAEDAKLRTLVYGQESEGHNLINAEMKAHPIEEGAPVVTINWSEHPAFYSFPDDSLVLSVAAADNILRALDIKQHMTRGTGDESAWYYKTKFTITGKDDSGEEFSYTGRYDLGDNDGGLLEHIRTLSEYYRTHTAFGQPVTNPPETTDGLELVKLLSRFVA